jgi:hypothetical protein
MILAALLAQAALDLGMQTAALVAETQRPVAAANPIQPNPFAQFGASIRTPRLAPTQPAARAACWYEYRYEWVCGPVGCGWVYRYVWVCN